MLLFFLHNSIASRCRHPYKNAVRCLNVYAMGQNWSGALGIGTDNDHDDDDVLYKVPLPKDVVDIKSVAAGWGHTAMVVECDGADDDDDGRRNRLLVCGMPHDFRGLLRLYRLPGFLRSAAIAMSKFLSPSSDNVDEAEDRMTLNRKARVDPILYSFEEIRIHGDEPSDVLDASAGISAIIGRTGALYCFGINSYGQCGVGSSSVNVWDPTAVVGLSSVKLPSWEDYKRKDLAREAPIIDVKLGLQHALALDANGILYSFGKNERAQLGNIIEDGEETFSSMITYEPCQPYANMVTGLNIDDPVEKIATGFNHNAVLCKSGKIYLFGKNMRHSSSKKRKILSKDLSKPDLADITIPKEIKGLPERAKIIDISCGSHHTAILLDDGSIWGLGIASNAPVLISKAVQLVPTGKIKLPLRQFDSFFNRTIIVTDDGKEVLEIKLLSGDEDFSSISIPEWLDDVDPKEKIRSIHYGWKHKIIITE